MSLMISYGIFLRRKAMKKIFSVLLIFALVLTIIPICVQATEEKSGIWTYSTDGENAHILQCDQSVSGTVTIPAAIDGRQVVDISAYTFSDCKNITAFTVEDGSLYSAIDGVLYKSTAFFDSDGKASTGLSMLSYPAAKADKSFTTPENTVTVFFNITNMNLEAVTLSKYVYGFSGISMGGNINYLPSLKEINVSAENANMYSADGILFGKSGSFDAVGNENEYTTLVAYPCGKTASDYSVPADVCTVGTSAFAFNSNLKTLTLSDSVEKIGTNAFKGCTGLAEIVFSEGFTSLNADMLTDTALYKDNGNWQSGALYYNHCLLGLNSDTVEENFTIKDGTAAVSDCALKGCSKVKSIVVPDSVKIIGSEAFSWCDNLADINLGNGVENIGKKAFAGCVSLKNAEIPDSVTYLGDSAFSGCILLEDVKIGEGLETVPTEAFKNCTCLSSISIPQNVKAFGDKVFSGCAMLETVSLHSGIINIDKDDFTGTAVYNNSKENGMVTIFGYLVYAEKNLAGEIAIKDGTTNICSNAFEYCSGIEKVTLPDTLINIGSYAFNECGALSDMNFPSSVKTIGEFAFNGTYFKGIELNEGLEACGNSAFKNSYLTSVNIPSSVKELGDSIFSGCSFLTEITVEEGNENYASEDGVLYTKDKTVLIKCPENKSGALTVANTVVETKSDSIRTISLEEINLPASLKNESIIIENCPNLKEINVDSGNESFSSVNGILYNKSQTELIRIPQNYENDVVLATSVETILSNAGSGCKGIKALDNLGKVKTIGDKAFADCEALGSVNLPNSLVEIGDNAFSNTALTSVTLPASVASVSNAFSNCAALTDISVDSANISFSSTDGILYNHDKTKLLLYPCMKESESFDIPDSVETIAEYAFSNANKLVSITFGNNLKNIGDYAFNNCTSVSEITLPDSVNSIGNNAFAFCTGLKSAELGNGVQSIGFKAFQNCTSLESIVLPDSITYLNSYIFKDCTALSNVTIGSGIFYIPCGMFYGCSSLNSVEIPSNITIICYEAFLGCGMTEASIPYTVETVEENAFGYRRSANSFSIEKIEGFTIKCYDESAGKDYADKNSFTAEILPDGDRPLRKTLTDETSGIEIKYNSAFEDGVTLNVNRVYDGTSFTIIGKELEAVNSAVYDINVLKDDQKVQPNDAVTVRIPVPENFDTSNLVACYINNETQTLEILPMTVVDGYAVFKTTHFSYYALVQLSAGNVTGVSVNDVTVTSKKSVALTPAISADPGAEYVVKYESSNPKIAAVDANGNVYGAKRGSATITCTVTDSNGNTVSDSCNVKVKYSFGQWLIVILLFGWIWY